MTTPHRLVLALSCPDRMGVVRAPIEGFCGAPFHHVPVKGRRAA